MQQKPKVALPEEGPKSNTEHPVASREKRHMTVISADEAEASGGSGKGCQCVIS